MWYNLHSISDVMYVDVDVDVDDQYNFYSLGMQALLLQHYIHANKG